MLQGKTFLILLARPNGSIRHHKILWNYFGQFVWNEKSSHYISRVSLHEALTKKIMFLHKRYARELFLSLDFRIVKIRDPKVRSHKIIT